jgi:HSP20 family protein
MTSMNILRPSSTPARAEQRTPTVSPLVDVLENDHEILLVADVPGVPRDGVDIHVEQGRLSLYARRARPQTEKPESHTVLRTEQRAHDYHRIFTLPTGIDATKIDAELKGGVLTVHLPKAEALKPRRIEVKTS